MGDAADDYTEQGFDQLAAHRRGECEDQCPYCDDERDEPSGVWEQCWNCHGDGGFHDCGEDCCPCLHPELDLNEPCEECDGKGGYYV